MKVNEKGEGNVGCFLFVALFIFVIVVAFKAGPTYINAMQFQRDIEKLTFKAGAFYWSKEKIESKIMELASEYQQPFSKRNLRVSIYRNNIVVKVDYYITLDFIVYQYRYHIKNSFTALRGGF